MRVSTGMAAARGGCGTAQSALAHRRDLRRACDAVHVRHQRHLDRVVRAALSRRAFGAERDII
jgi:hypothetical protein